ncbi:MAG: YfhO family protein [Lachnospiraceae bacterium]|nr:YfhO family protein [Lachnospiraceae bacterium]
MSFLTKTDKRIKDHLYLSSFFISLVLLILYSIIQGIFPFGSATFLRKDLYHQYLPFLYEFRRRLISGQSLKFSFDLGLGSSFYAMYVYYLSDPLNFLSVLVPESFLLEFLTLITYCKIAAASSFMCRYLRFRCPDSPALYALPLSLCYGFSGYIASFDWNVMWMWGIALAPLVILGFEKMLRGEGKTLYIITWAFLVWTNYYIAMLMGIFLVLYFIILSVEEYRGLLSLLKNAGRAFISTILAAGISAVLLIPELAAIKDTSFTGKTFPSQLKFYLSPPEIMTRAIMAVHVETGLGHEPALYASLIILFFIPLYFMNKGIPQRSRIARGIFILFFILSFNTNILEFIWHGLNYPDSIPARQSFLFVIICLTCVYSAIEGIKDTDRKMIAVAAAVPVLYYIICLIFCRNEEHTDLITWIMNPLFILMYLLLLFLYVFHSSDHKRYGFCLFTLILLFELAFNFNLTSLRDVSRESYFRHKDSYYELAEEALKDDRLNDGMFARLDTADENIRNVSSLSGYHDLSYFSSTIDKRIVAFFKSFGLKASRVHYMGEGLTPFTSAIMDTGYVLANHQDNNQTASDIAVLVDETNEDYLYKNLFSLPFGCSIPAGHYELYEDSMVNDDPIYLQNTTAVRLGGDKIFNIIDEECISEKKGEAVIDIPEDGHYYAWSDREVSEVTEYIDDFDEACGEFEDMKYNSIMDLGLLKAGSRVTLKCENKVYPDIRLYLFDPESMRSLIDNLSRESFTLTEFNEDHIEGNVNISEGRQLLITVPYSEGWEIMLDGDQGIEPDKFYGLFMLLSIPPGVHRLSLTYYIPCFNMGITVSMICLVLTSLLIIQEIIAVNRQQKLST